MNNLFNNFKNIGKNVGKNVDNVEDIANKMIEASKKKFKLWLLSIVGAALPYFLVIIMVVIIVAAVLSPMMGLFGGLSSEVDSNGNEIRSKELTEFVNTVEDRKEYWLDKNVNIDTNLVYAFLFYANPDTTSEIECEEEEIEDCLAQEEQDYNALAKEAIDLMDNMVYSKKIYYCQPKTEVTKEVCTPDYTSECYMTTKGIVCEKQICKDEVIVSLEDKKVCGPTKESCSGVCGSNYETTNEELYYLKTKEEYITWLKENYIEDKLISLEYDIPTAEVEKQELIDETIEEIFLIGDSFSENNSELLSGIVITGYGQAGPIPKDLLNILKSPLGTQYCSQSSCFGNYGPNNCASHGGVDIVSSGSGPAIYSIAAGKVVTVVKNGKNCKPDFTKVPKCSKGCSGNIVTIKHDILVNGEIQTFYSKYVHLDSVAGDIEVGTEVFQGQMIGIMGNTGCSTGVHLHFEILSATKKSYNPEELIYETGCKPLLGNLNACSQARATCGS